MPYLESTDGMRDIVCNICGETIIRGAYIGFTTATCIKCQNNSGSNIVEESIPLELRPEKDRLIDAVAETTAIIASSVVETTERIRKVWRKKKADKSESKIKLKRNF